MPRGSGIVSPIGRFVGGCVTAVSLIVLLGMTGLCLRSCAYRDSMTWFGDVDRRSRSVDPAGEVAFPLTIDSLRGYLLVARRSYYGSLANIQKLLFSHERLSNLGYDPVRHAREDSTANPATVVSDIDKWGMRLLISHATEVPKLYQDRWVLTAVVPMWPLILAALPLPVRFGYLKWRGWRWRRGGKCVECGYDLRASEGRCPECGEVIEPRESVGRVV